MIRIRALKACATSSLLSLALSHAVLAQEHSDAPFKLTYGAYRYSDQTTGQDLNLRWESPGLHVWIGHYADQSFGHQTRVGFDRGIALNEAAQLQVSMQVASSHFSADRFSWLWVIPFSYWPAWAGPISNLITT